MINTVFPLQMSSREFLHALMQRSLTADTEVSPEESFGYAEQSVRPMGSEHSELQLTTFIPVGQLAVTCAGTLVSQSEDSVSGKGVALTVGVGEGVAVSVGVGVGVAVGDGRAVKPRRLWRRGRCRLPLW